MGAMRVNLSVVEPIANWNKQIANAKKNYKKELLNKEFSTVIEDVRSYKAALQTQVTEALKQIDAELVAIKKPEEPKRNFDVETVTILNYFSKVIQSKIASAGDTQGGFLKVLEEVAIHDDEKMRMAFIDGYHDVMKAGRDLIGRIGSEGNQLASERPEAFESRIHEQYTIARDSLKDPAQLALEKEELSKEAAMEKEKWQISFGHSTANDHLEGTLVSFQRDYMMNADDDKSSNGNLYFG